MKDGDFVERLSGEYNRGYSRAIQDIIEIFEYIQSDLSFHKKRINAKLALRLLKVILTEREKIRDNWRGFIRWNTQKQDFEFYRTGGNDNEKDV